MTTKTKSKNNSKSSGKSAIVGPRPAIEYLRTVSLDLDNIVPSPFQPRSAIWEADLQGLAAVIAAHGFLDSIWVRELPDGRYELLDGERRWRAARLAHQVEIRADVFICTDAQARQLALLSVIHREDLGPIERARAFQAMLADGEYGDQKRLAAAMGVDPSTISNLVRLLKLPSGWQERIVSREISERHARALLPYIKYPSLVTAFDAYFQEVLSPTPDSEPSDLPAVAEWESETVPEIIRTATRSMDGPTGERTYYDSQRGQVAIFVPDVVAEKKLQIIEINGEHLATNVQLWEELQAAYTEAMRHKAETEGMLAPAAGTEDVSENRTEYRQDAEDEELAAEDGGEEAEENPRSDPLNGYSAEERRQLADQSLFGKLTAVYERHLRDEIRLERPALEFIQDMREQGFQALDRGANRDKALDLIEQYWQAQTKPSAAPGPSEFFRWKLAWTRKLIAEALVACEFVHLTKIFVFGRDVLKLAADDTLFDEALRGNMDFQRRKSTAANLFACHDFQFEKVLAEVVSAWFWNEKQGPVADVPAGGCELVASLLAIDLAEQWQSGNILAPRALLDLYDEPGLHKLAEKWKLNPDPLCPRAKLIGILERAIMDPAATTTNLPLEVTKAKE